MLPVQARHGDTAPTQRLHPSQLEGCMFSDQPTQRRQWSCTMQHYNTHPAAWAAHTVMPQTLSTPAHVAC
jgi:hypothetical protein